MTPSALLHFEETEALLQGHFLLTSGLHSDRYLQCARVLMYPDRAEALAEQLTEKIDSNPSIVVGPAIGGITFAYEMGRALGCPAVFAERVNGQFELRRGFHIAPGTRVLVAEDVVTTGGSVIEVIDMLRGRGADVVGVASLVHRAKASPFDVPYSSLLQIIPPTWTESECPLCEAGGRPEKPGSRARPGEGASAC